MKTFILPSLLSPKQANQTFQRHFPYLKLEMILEPGKPLLEDQNEVSLQQIHSVSGPVTWLVVDPNMSINAFEIAFHYTFGVRVKVQRRSGYTWDDLENNQHSTLHQQNQKGQELAIHYNADK
jgi:hypothetical protein